MVVVVVMVVVVLVVLVVVVVVVMSIYSGSTSGSGQWHSQGGGTWVHVPPPSKQEISICLWLLGGSPQTPTETLPLDFRYPYPLI